MKRLILFTLIILGICTIVNAQNIKIHSGTNFILNGSTNMIIQGNLDNNGTITPGSSLVKLNGSTDQTISGGSTTQFNDLEIDKSGGEINLSSNIAVSNNLTMTNGIIDLQNQNLDLGSSGTIVGETNSNRIIVSDINNHSGTITTSRNLNNPSDVNPGNIGISITSNKNLGNITVTRGHKVITANGGNKSIARSYEITPSIGKLDDNTTVEINYLEDELNLNPEDHLIVYQSVTEGRDTWWTPLSGSINTSTNTGTPDSSPYSNYFNSSWYGFTYHTEFTMGYSDNPLPIELVSFNGECYDNYIELKWITASEKNNEKFIIEKSFDGENFNKITTIPGSGNSHTQENYSFIDKNKSTGSFYRLKQVDFNGDYSYSDIITVNCDDSDSEEPYFNVHPNPFRNNLFIKAGNLPSSSFTIEIFSMDGKIQRNYEFNSDKRGLREQLNLENLVPSMYTIRIISKDFVRTYKINKQ